MIEITDEMMIEAFYHLNSDGKPEDLVRAALSAVAPIIAAQLEGKSMASEDLLTHNAELETVRDALGLECNRLSAHNDALKAAAAVLEADLRKARAQLNQAEVQLQVERLQSQAATKHMRAMMDAAIEAACNVVPMPPIIVQSQQMDGPLSIEK